MKSIKTSGIGCCGMYLIYGCLGVMMLASFGALIFLGVCCIF